MRIPGRGERAASAAAASADRPRFENYRWDAHRAAGWWEAVVLTATDTETKAGAPMIRVEFGLESPDDSIGGRVDYYAPESYPPKVEALLRVFLPALLDSDEATDLDPKALLYQRCALRLEIDESWQRHDGRPSWTAAALTTLAQADEDLGPDWRQRVLEALPAPAPDPEADPDVF